MEGLRRAICVVRTPLDHLPLSAELSAVKDAFFAEVHESGFGTKRRSAAAH